MSVMKGMQSPKVIEISRLTAHSATKLGAARRDPHAPRLGTWPSNQQPSSSTANASAS